jgi:hypothetical protein
MNSIIDSEQVTYECLPTFATVRDFSDLTLEWCFKRFRVWLGTDEKFGAGACISIFDEATSVMVFPLTAPQLGKALWIQRAEGDDAAYTYLRNLSGHDKHE